MLGALVLEAHLPGYARPCLPFECGGSSTLGVENRPQAPATEPPHRESTVPAGECRTPAGRAGGRSSHIHSGCDWRGVHSQPPSRASGTAGPANLRGVQRHDPTAELLSSQAGAISRRQALTAGLTSRQVEGRVATGRWSRLLPGVYLSADAPLSWEAWGHGLLLASGPGARVVGESAVALRGLAPKRLPITVAIPAERRCDVRRENLRLLRLDIPAECRITIDGFPTTTRLRTAVDVAHLLSSVEAQPIIDRMLVLDLVSLEPLTEAVDASLRQGSARARRLMASANDLAAAESERRARRLLAASGLRGWQSNYRVVVGGRKLKLDLALPRLRIAIEVKGWMFHSTSDRGASDDWRLTALQLAGWVVIPVGWLTLNRDPDQFIRQVREAVESRSPG
jgi:very-short-patch-repair endonuclease